MLPTATTVPQRLPVRVLGDTGRIAWSVPNRPTQLSNEALAAVLPRVATLIAEPDTLALGLGDSVFVPLYVRFLAVDAHGVVLGELRQYDFRSSSGVGPLRSGAMRAFSLGTATFTASWPRRALPEGGASPPAAKLAIVVTPVTGVVVPPVRATTGSARVSGTVQEASGRPLGNITVTAHRRSVTVASTTTDADGRYEFTRLPAGVVTLIVQRLGYAPGRREVLLTGTSDIAINIVMSEPSPPSLQSHPPR